jgi:hypothetical protein
VTPGCWSSYCWLPCVVDNHLEHHSWQAPDSNLNPDQYHTHSAPAHLDTRCGAVSSCNCARVRGRPTEGSLSAFRTRSWRQVLTSSSCGKSVLQKARPRTAARRSARCRNTDSSQPAAATSGTCAACQQVHDAFRNIHAVFFVVVYFAAPSSPNARRGACHMPCFADDTQCNATQACRTPVQLIGFNPCHMQTIIHQYTSPLTLNKHVLTCSSNARLHRCTQVGPNVSQQPVSTCRALVKQLPRIQQAGRGCHRARLERL